MSEQFAPENLDRLARAVLLQAMCDDEVHASRVDAALGWLGYREQERLNDLRAWREAQR